MLTPKSPNKKLAVQNVYLFILLKTVRSDTTILVFFCVHQQLSGPQKMETQPIQIRQEKKKKK